MFCFLNVFNFLNTENSGGKKGGEATSRTREETAKGGGEKETARRGEAKTQRGREAEETHGKGYQNQGLTTSSFGFFI